MTKLFDIYSEDFLMRNEIIKTIYQKYLTLMMNDRNFLVRTEVAKKIDPKYLPEMLNDIHWYVRVEVAKRIDPKYLSEMSDYEILYLDCNHHNNQYI